MGRCQAGTPAHWAQVGGAAHCFGASNHGYELGGLSSRLSNPSTKASADPTPAAQATRLTSPPSPPARSSAIARHSRSLLVLGAASTGRWGLLATAALRASWRAGYPLRRKGVVMSGYVYAFRYGDGDHVKIGKSNDLTKRRNQLQVAHYNPVVLVQSIEDENYADGERYIHKLLGERRLRQAGERGSREHFLVTDDELELAFAKTRRYLREELPNLRRLQEYEGLEASDEILPATDSILQIKHRLEELRSRRTQLLPERHRLDAELRAVAERQQVAREHVNSQIADLDAEEACLITAAKLAIGPARGIDGVATWESVADPRRHFDQDWLKGDTPDLYDRYRTAFDAARFRKEQRDAYEAHMRVTKHREFRWVGEEEFVKDVVPLVNQPLASEDLPDK